MVHKSALSMFVAAFALLPGAAALAQSDPDDKTLDRAGKIASQPVRDVGLAKNKIPVILLDAVEKPYGLASTRCPRLVTELASLDEALGPDFDAPPRGEDDKVTRIAEAGGQAVVNSLIPFRGLVREVTGAASADRQYRAAVNAGIARRGFLRGVARMRGCKLPPPPPAEVKPAK